ncbi:hypothetical protein [Nocardia xishanensis]
MPHHNKTHRLLVDEIDALVDQQLAAPRDSGKTESCPHCPDEWHSLPIRKDLLLLRLMYCGCEDCDRLLDAYDYARDTSPIICPGSTFHGPVEPLPARMTRHGIEIVVLEPVPVPRPRPAPVPPLPQAEPPDGCALRFPFPESEHYRGPIWAYKLSRTWRGADYVVVVHIERDTTGTGSAVIPETVLFRYFPPGLPQPAVRETYEMAGQFLSILDDDSDADGYRAAIDSHGVNVEIDADSAARHRADGHVNPDVFVQMITGQMVLGVIE